MYVGHLRQPREPGLAVALRHPQDGHAAGAEVLLLLL